MNAHQGEFRKSESVTDNLLVRIHFIIEMSRWTGLAPWKFEFPFPGSLASTFLGGESMFLVVRFRDRTFFRNKGPRFKVWSFGFTIQCSRFRVLDARFRIWGLGSWVRVHGWGLRVSGAGFRVQSSGFRVQGSGFRIQGSGWRVQGLGCRVQGLGLRGSDPHGAAGDSFEQASVAPCGLPSRVCRV